MYRQQHEQETAYWESWVNARRAAMRRDDPAERDQAMQEILAVDDPAAIAALESRLSTASEAAALAVVKVLGKLKEQSATDSLVRHAVLADSEQVRQAAAAELSSRSWCGYVPILLGNLKTPIELAYTFAAFDDGVSSTLVFERDGPNAITRHVQSMQSLDLWAYGYAGRQTEFGRRVQRRNLWEDARIRWEQAARIQRQVEQTNRSTAAMNQRIYAALRKSTAQQFDDQPQPWWQWWQQYNELHTGKQTPTFQTVSAVQFRRAYSCSCFLRGTLVWTVPRDGTIPYASSASSVLTPRRLRIAFDDPTLTPKLSISM